MVVPIYYMFYLAFSARGNAFAFPPTFIPNPFAWENVFAAPVDGTRSLWGYARNSIIYATLATLGCLLAETITGYALARLRFPGRGVIFALTVAMLMMPFVVTMIPRFLLFKNFGMIDTLWPLILPWWFGGAPYGIFLMRQFFLTVPPEIDEAARVDGAGPWRTLWLILVPQSVPVLVALGMLHFAYFWNDLLGPIIYCQSQGCMTLTQGILFNYKSNWDPQWELFMMSALLMTVPVAIIFIILQRRFKQAFLFSGLGGR
jgi:multiple sugar transport system permease protein